jgi:hypothetical protein
VFVAGFSSKTSVYAFSITLGALLLQSFVISPLEENFRTDQYVSIVSFVYISHGVKVLLALTLGLAAFPAIFLAALINALLFWGVSITSFTGALIGIVSLGIPLILHNASVKKDLWHPPIFNNEVDFSALWLYLSFSLIGSFANGLLHSALYGFHNDALPFYFILGDNIGALVVFLFVMMIRRIILLKTIRELG